MKKNFTLLIFSIFLFAAQASADTLDTIYDTWVDWPGYVSNVPGQDELGTPKIDRMEVTRNDSGYLKNIDIVLHDSSSWQRFNSLFINSYADVGAKGTGWDDWDYLVHDGDTANSANTIGNIPGNGIWQVDRTGYQYTMTNDNWAIRQDSPNGIDSDFLTDGTAGNGWVHTSTYIYSYSFLNLGIDLSKGAFIAFAPFCANDVIGGNINPVPEPATMALLGIGLLGLAGVARRRVSK